MIMINIKYTVVVFSLAHLAFCGSIPPPPLTERIQIRKCCNESSYMTESLYCRRKNNSFPVWKPSFQDFTGKELQPAPPFDLQIGKPVCRSREPWVVHNHTSPYDLLILRSDGKLRHKVFEDHSKSEHSEEDIEEVELFQDYNVTEYCLDQILYEMNKSITVGEMAMICIPESIPWHDNKFLMQRIVNPAFHIVAIACFLIVSVIYVVLPQLCDLVGNMVTTLAVCLIFVQVSDIIKIFDEYHSGMSYLVSDAVMYISSLGAFFWLNSLGYYIWKTFRSRNVFLRVTDGRKYCCYSVYAWGATFSMGSMALFAHLVLNTNTAQTKKKSIAEAAIAELGVAVVLTTIACTIFVNLFFCLSTLQIINRMSSYGRIHHKLKYSFQLFVKVFIILTTNWFFLILSWFPVNGLFYIHVFVNLFHAVGILYATVLSVSKVRFLLAKACCHEKCVFPCCRPGDPGEVTEWGEEMMAMNVRGY